MTSRPIVSICLPVFNGDQFLAEAIESALAQTFENFELIISDDSSTDRSSTIIQQYASADKRVKSLKNPRNLGLFANYNECIQAASGTFIKLFAQDDLLHKDMVGRLVDVLQCSPDIALVSSARRWVDKMGNQTQPKIAPTTYFSEHQRLAGREAIKMCLLPINNLIGEPTTVMFRKEHAGAGFDASFHHVGDLEFWFRLLLKGSYCYLNEELCSFRLHEHSASTANEKFLLYVPDVLRIGRKYKSFIAESGNTQREFNDAAIRAVVHEIHYRGPAFKKDLLDREPQFLTDFTAYLQSHSIHVDPAEFLELALQAIIRLPFASLTEDRSAIVASLEAQLQAYMNSASWKMTRGLRDFNRLFGNVGEPVFVHSEKYTEPVEIQREYELYLRKQIRHLKHSRSWLLTQPVRLFVPVLQGILKQFKSPDNSSVRTEKSLTAAATAKPEASRQSSSILPAPSAAHPAQPITKKQQSIVAAQPPLAVSLLSPDTGLAPAPLVSIIMPTWNRAHSIERAIESVLAQTHSNWECLIVDDGSTDNTNAVVSRFLHDQRFRYHVQEHANCSVARNAALARASGELIAYLDTDNVWLPHYLSAIVSAFVAEPETNAVYTGQIVQNRQDNSKHFLRCEQFDYNKLLNANFIDLNVFAHRRELVDRLGGFDEKLESLTDWDLILRYAGTEKIKFLPVIGGVYSSSIDDSVTENAPHAYSRYLIESSRAGQTQNRLKVLYALWHYPQLSESYIEFEIRAVSKLGVDVEVWSESGVASSYDTDIPVHRGSLQEAIRQVQPDLVHTHWMQMAKKFEPLLRECKLPMTVRSHGFEFADKFGPLVADLDKQSIVRAVYLFPHHALAYADSSSKIKALPISFDPELYLPNKNKNRSLVIRTGAALESKDYRCFMETAQRCPNHQFLLAIVAVKDNEDYVDEIVKLNRSLGSPVELLVNLQYAEVARKVAEAGTYMHTTLADEPFGMPISIAEAMATGCYLLLRRRPETLPYGDNAASYYDTAEEAARLINQTLYWHDDAWMHAYRRSVERAYGNFVSTSVLTTLVSDWDAIVRQHQSVSLQQSELLVPEPVPSRS